MPTPAPNLQLYIQDGKLCIARVRRDGEDAALVVDIGLAQLKTDEQAASLGRALLHHLTLLYPDQAERLPAPPPAPAEPAIVGFHALLHVATQDRTAAYIPALDALAARALSAEPHNQFLLNTWPELRTQLLRHA